ncbi:MAG: hypothetical protein J5802_08465 [Butyrivibrio sp.]|nr:hypothetical protein [Butyrivibrio sp.]
MTFDKYINPNFTLVQKLIFLGIAAAGILASVILIAIGTRFSVIAVDSSERQSEYAKRGKANVQLFYEMIITGTCAIFFASAYVVCNHISDLISHKTTFYALWSNNKDYMLLAFICASCVVNTILDSIFIPLRRISKDQKASIRILGMFYAIAILSLLSYGGMGDKKIYETIILYYPGLVVGRFVYFDASFVDFLKSMWGAIIHLPYLVMGLAISIGMSALGFRLNYLLDKNFVIVGVLYSHLFLLAAIFVINLFRISNIFFRGEDDEYEYDDDEEEDDEDDEEDDEVDEDSKYDYINKSSTRKVKKNKQIKVYKGEMDYRKEIASEREQNKTENRDDFDYYY